MAQRFGRRAVYVVVGDGVEEEAAAKKVWRNHAEIMLNHAEIVLKSCWNHAEIMRYGITKYISTAIF